MHKPELSVCVKCWAITSLLNSAGGMNTVLPKDIPSSGVLMTVVESAYTAHRTLTRRSKITRITQTYSC